jgi:hypothetical protein
MLWLLLLLPLLLFQLLQQAYWCHTLTHGWPPVTGPCVDPLPSCAWPMMPHTRVNLAHDVTLVNLAHDVTHKLMPLSGVESTVQQ